MNRIKGISFAVLVVVACVGSGCDLVKAKNVTGPSEPATPVEPPSGSGTGSSYLGVWSSNAVTGIPDPKTCANIQWRITSQTATAITGEFSGTCAAVVTVSGTAAGQLGGSTIPMSASGTATAPGVPACSFLLTGTGTPEGSSLRIQYSGTTCLGPLSGTETLRRNPLAPPAPPPAPTPPPAPAPAPTPPAPPAAPDPLWGCSQIREEVRGAADQSKLVDCIHIAVNPARTEHGAFEVTKRVAWALRDEGAGLLIKDSGENIVQWRGIWFSAGRICYPDGHIFKVLSDIPATNGPSWQDNDYVERNRYVPAIDPNLP